MQSTFLRFTNFNVQCSEPRWHLFCGQLLTLIYSCDSLSVPLKKTVVRGRMIKKVAVRNGIRQ